MESISNPCKPQTLAFRLAAWLRLLVLASVGVLCVPTQAMAWWNHDWAFRKQIAIDASPKGADVKSDLSDVPVLIRLHEGVFKFTDANPDGADLRFIADDDKTPLKFHIEKFDPVFNLAFVWVQLPGVKAGQPVNIWMYYGNAKSAAGDEPRETYDSNQTLVYHFAERGKPAADSTSYKNNATTPFTVDESGLIGNSAKFDGQSVVVLPASQSLNVPAGAALTWSAWIKPATADDDGIVYAQHGSTRAGLIIGLAKGQPYVAITDEAGVLHQSPYSPPITDKGWHHLALVTGAQTTLYLDGQPGPVFAVPLPALNAAATLGGDGGQAGVPVSAGFKGEIDELQISRIARDAGLIKLAASNQGTQDKLVQFGGDEGLSTWSTGYFGIIIKSVTFDAWVVIGVLMAMSAISWVVMYTKGSYTNRVTRANDIFTKQFHTLRADLTNLESAQAMSEKDREAIRESSLFRMYEVGVTEIRHRFEIQGQASALLAESIESIRASVDATSVRENQRLSKGMVLLTIAISGGPFIGLLGTVVGVMITFAAIAAAGDVNINAIAPGISAALLATVAGMAVAIPALFGYNYLLGRIKDIQANMAVFVDEFVTRMAEMYPASAYGQVGTSTPGKH